MIEEKKTFKGYVNKTISIEDYIKLEAGYTIKNEKKTKKPWMKTLRNGISIPDDDDYMTKKHHANVNILKRQPPNVNGIMYPYNTRETEKICNENVDYVICES